MGLLIPANWLEAIGVNNHIYHIGAVYIGSVSGIITLIGMLLLTLRRLSIKNVRRLSSFSDIFVNIVLLIILIMGCYSTLVTNAIQPEFDYRQTIAIWFRHLFMFSPNADLMLNVPWSFKLHILLGFTVFACWPFYSFSTCLECTTVLYEQKIYCLSQKQNLIYYEVKVWNQNL